MIRNTMARKLATAMGLDPDDRRVTVVDVQREINNLLTGIRDEENQANDPRERLRVAAERLAKEKNVGFLEALERVKAAEPQLVEAAAREYRLRG